MGLVCSMEHIEAQEALSERGFYSPVCPFCDPSMWIASLAKRTRAERRGANVVSDFSKEQRRRIGRGSNTGRRRWPKRLTRGSTCAPAGWFRRPRRNIASRRRAQVSVRRDWHGPPRRIPLRRGRRRRNLRGRRCYPAADYSHRLTSSPSTL